MNLFQVLASLVVAGLLFVTLVATWRGRATRRDGLLWSALWAVALAAIVWPEITTVVANALGIRRGADLVMYCSVVVMMVGFLMVYARLRRVRRDITLLVRRLAIRDAMEGPLTGGETDSRPPSREDTPARQ